MLTDDEIDDHAARIHNELDPRDAPTHRRVDALIAQAREANALRAQLAFMRDDYVEHGGRPCALCVYDNGKFVRSCKLHQLLAEARQMLAAQEPVIAVTDRWEQEMTKHGHSMASLDVFAAVRDLRAYLASHQPTTNVPALISSMVVARVTTDEAGETTMEPATVDGEVKR